MDTAKVTEKGQITLPPEIRKRFGFREGSKVLFVEEGDKVYLMSSTMAALHEAQAEFQGVAEEIGIADEEELVEIMKEFRKQRAAEK